MTQLLQEEAQSPPRHASISYMPALDGLRAIAVAAVLVFHVAPAALPGGFIGVDLFFVLSGFLITTLVLRDLDRNAFSFAAFYARRVRRLMPNLIVTVFVTVILWRLCAPPGAAIPVALHGLWTLFDLSNFYILRNLGDYWSSDAEWAPLTHTWSLGVEEQFYLLYPAALCLLARFKPRRVPALLALLAAASLALCLVLVRIRPAIAFYMLPTRGWQLLLGAVLAAWRLRQAQRADSPFLVRSPLSPATIEALGALGLALVTASLVWISGTSAPYPGLSALVPSAGVALLIASTADGRTRLAALLSHPIPAVLGKLSYSLYLWHWPLIVLGRLLAERYGASQLGGALAGGTVSVVAAALAFVFVERPLRYRAASRPGGLAIIAAAFAVATACCALFMLQRPAVDPLHHFNTPAFYGKLYDAGKPALTNPAASVRYYDVYFPPVPASRVDAWRSGGIVHLYGGAAPRVVVLGSSHALMHSHAIDAACRDLGLSVAFLGVDNGTAPFFHTQVSRYVSLNPNFPTPRDALDFDATRLRLLRQWRPDTVLLIDRWDSYKPSELETDLRAFLDRTRGIVANVLFVAQVPALAQGGKGNLRGYVAWRMGQSNILPVLRADARQPARSAGLAVAEKLRARYPSLRIVRPDLLFQRADGSVRYAQGRDFFYVDDNHLSDLGAEQAIPLVREALTHTPSPTPERQP